MGGKYLTLDLKGLTNLKILSTFNYVGTWEGKKRAQLSCFLLISETGLSLTLALKHSLLSQGAGPQLFFLPQEPGQLLQVQKARPVFQEFLLFFPLWNSQHLGSAFKMHWDRLLCDCFGAGKFPDMYNSHCAGFTSKFNLIFKLIEIQMLCGKMLVWTWGILSCHRFLTVSI